jgi:hypothetical protein
MSLYKCTQTLLQTSDPTNVAKTGKAYALVTSAEGDIGFHAFIDLTQSGGSGSPTVEVHIETSHDGRWVDAVSPIGLTTDDSIHQFISVDALGPLVRARTVLGGENKPNHEITVKLAATREFRLKASNPPYDVTNDAPSSEGGPTAESSGS